MLYDKNSESDFFFFLHQNQNIFFSNIGNQNIFLFPNCNNWRGITLLSIPSKVFCIVLISRITDAVDKKLRQEQAGFRKGRGCIDHIFVLRNILEQCHEWQRKLLVNFVDFEKTSITSQTPMTWRRCCFKRDGDGLVMFYVNHLKT